MKYLLFLHSQKREKLKQESSANELKKVLFVFKWIFLLPSESESFIPSTWCYTFFFARVKKKLISPTHETFSRRLDTRHSSFSLQHNFIFGHNIYSHFSLFQMWIYSLGRTLMKTMPAILPPESDEKNMQQQHHSSIVLQATIWKMCKSVDERASLMFLLNVSVYSCCHLHHICSKFNSTYHRKICVYDILCVNDSDESFVMNVNVGRSENNFSKSLECVKGCNSFLKMLKPLSPFFSLFDMFGYGW